MVKVTINCTGLNDPYSGVPPFLAYAYVKPPGVGNWLTIFPPSMSWDGSAGDWQFAVTIMAEGWTLRFSDSPTFHIEEDRVVTYAWPASNWTLELPPPPPPPTSTLGYVAMVAFSILLVAGIGVSAWLEHRQASISRP